MIFSLDFSMGAIKFDEGGMEIVRNCGRILWRWCKNR